MNYISHHEVARQYNPGASTDFLFGSFAADFARMSGTRHLLRQATNPELLAGVKFHNLTNTAFDEQPDITQLEDDMKTSFNDFLAWRTARQASRAGKDLLFDGIQFDEPRIIEDLLVTLGSVLEGRVNLAGIYDPAPLIQVANWIYTNGPPRYDDVEVVAQRLFVTLSKTRTPLDPTIMSDVADVLETHQPTVFAIGPLAMQQTVASIREMDLSF